MHIFFEVLSGVCTDFLMQSVFLIKSAQSFFSFPQECTYFCCPATLKFRVSGSGFPVLACAGGCVCVRGGLEGSFPANPWGQWPLGIAWKALVQACASSGRRR